MRSVGVFVLAVCVCSGQETAPLPTIRSNAQEVLLDLIVRDKHERFIRDLKKGDVQVVEDGVPQTVKGFRLVAGSREKLVASEKAKGGEAKPAQADSAKDGVQSLPELNLVSLVFQDVSPANRKNAYSAATEFLKNQIGPNTYVGVFTLEYRLNALQEYTKDRTLLDQAVALAQTGNYTEFRHRTEHIIQQLSVWEMMPGPPSNDPSATLGNTGAILPTRATEGLGAPRPATPGGMQNLVSPLAGMASAEIGTGHQAQMLTNMEVQQLQGVGSSLGSRALDGLFALVEAQRLLPGRKTVILLSEGLVLPTSGKEALRALVSIANRANVSIYALDITGLTTYVSERTTIDHLSQAAAISQSQSDIATPDMFKQDDTVLTGFNTNFQANLQELAESTGGFLVANTNEYKKPLQHIMEDVDTHYELSYSPTSDNYDGRFRKVELQIARSGVRVQSRNGYYALPALSGQSVQQPFELACLRVLGAKTRPTAFPFRVHPARFRPGGGHIEHEMIFEIPIAGLTLTPVEESKLRTRVSVVALVKDESGQVVHKLSRDLGYKFPAARQEDARHGNLTVALPFRIVPGKYTVEAVALDRESDRASALAQEFSVKPAEAVDISDILVVRSQTKLPHSWDPLDPLETTGGRVTPALGAQTPGPVKLFFLVSGAAGVPPEVTLEILEDGKATVNAAMDLSGDPEAGIPVMYEDSLEAGTYTIRVTAKQGKFHTAREQVVRIGL